MKKKIFIFFIAAISIISLSAFVKTEDPILALIKKLEEFTKKYPQEKIHLQLEKPYFITGEDIWIKGYVVTAEKNEPSELSKILYIDLISPDNKIAKKITLTIDSGKAFGQLSIPDSIVSGNYRIRAYTNYMRNFGDEYFFERFIPIGNLTEANKSKSIQNTKKSIDLQFFPEGGNMIYGLRGKVGLKVTNENGIGLSVSGYIIDDTKEKVAVFSTEFAGMGTFALNPTKGKTYQAIIEKEDGSITTYKLPKALDNGYSLSINSLLKPDSILIKVATTPDLVKGQQLSLLAQCNGVVFFTSIINMDNQIFTASIPKITFPTGIVQFTLFSEQNPIAERIIFINHDDQLKINLALKKSKVIDNQTIFNISTTDYNNNPIDGNFSVSITDLNKIPFNEADENTITSNLLLTSDLKGFIEQPNYYFTNVNPDKERHLDNLLLTQGWRRFLWKDITDGKEIPLNYLPEKSLTIAGLITDNNSKPLVNAKVTLVSITNGFDMILDTVTNNKGKFVFDRLDVPDTVNFMVQAKSSKNDKNVKITMEQDAQVSSKNFIGNSINMDTYVSYAKQKQKDIPNPKPAGIQLKQVNIFNNKDLKPIVNVLNSKNRNGSVDYVVSKDRIEHETGNAFDIFNNVPGVKMQEKKIIRSMTNTVSISQNLGGKPQPMAVYLDGARVDQDVLLTTPAASVEGIEILVSNYNTMIYEDGYWGVILVTTKMGNSLPMSKDIYNNLITVSNKGFTVKKEFYTPLINVKEPKLNTNPMLSTLYWNPNLNTNINGKATITLQNLDPNTTYKIIIEGMDTYGNIGRKVMTYGVSPLN